MKISRFIGFIIGFVFSAGCSSSSEPSPREVRLPQAVVYSVDTLHVPNGQTRQTEIPTVETGGAPIEAFEIIGSQFVGMSIASNGVISADDRAALGNYAISVSLKNSAGSAEFFNVLTVARRKVTFAQDIQPMFTARCSPCHRNAPVSFLEYSYAKSKIDLIVERAVTQKTMPPQGAEMSQADRDLIRQWKTDGLLQ